MQEYIVKPKDSLWKIAKHFSTTVDALARANGLKGRQIHDLSIGQKLRIPAGDKEGHDCQIKLRCRGLDAIPFKPKSIKVEHDGKISTHTMEDDKSLLLSIFDHAKGLKVWIEDMNKKLVQVMDHSILPIGKWELSIDSRKIKVQGNMLPEKGKPETSIRAVKAATTSKAQQSGGQTAQEQTRIEGGVPVHAVATIYTSENLRLDPKNEKYRELIIATAKKYDHTPQSLAALINAEAACINGMWDENSNRGNRQSAKGMTQFLEAAWKDVWKNEKSLLCIDCKDLSQAEVLEKRYVAKYAIDAAAAFAQKNMVSFRDRTQWPVDSLPPEDKAKLQYLLHHEGLDGALRAVGKGVTQTPENAEICLFKQIKNRNKVDQLINQYNDPIHAYNGWLYNSLIDQKINVSHFLVNLELAKSPRKMSEIISFLSSQPPLIKPKTRANHSASSAASTQAKTTKDPNKPTATSLPIANKTPVASPSISNGVQAAPPVTKKPQPAEIQSQWFDPLSTCTLREAGLATIKGATFGMVRKKPNGDPKAHQGIDLAAEPGTPIRAVADGTIYCPSNISGDYGIKLLLTVGINDLPEAQASVLRAEYPKESTITFLYAHLSKITPKNNDKVHAGDIIGKSGCTGNASKMTKIVDGAHLHFEAQKTNATCGLGLENRIDPLPFIKNCTNIKDL